MHDIKTERVSNMPNDGEKAGNLRIKARPIKLNNLKIILVCRRVDELVVADARLE